MRVTTAHLAAIALIAGGVAAAPQEALAKPRPHGATVPRAAAVTAATAPASRRPRVRIYGRTDTRGVYPSYFPGENAVRDCSVNYVQEFRPSGTVIVPRMRCFWRQP